MKLLLVLGLMLGLATPVLAQEAAFSEVYDLVPARCFSAALSTVDADSIDIGIETGTNSTTWINKACVASTKSFNTKTNADTFAVTITAPTGRTISKIHYEQEGQRLVERPTYWATTGTGMLTVNAVNSALSFSSQPTLNKTVDLTGQEVSVARVVVSISLVAYRNSSNPRVTNAPGSAMISVTSGVIRVEYE